MVGRRGDEAFTRSIKCLVKYHGMPLEVDLFPKLLDKDGKIWSLDKARNWVSGDSVPARAELDFEAPNVLSDEAKASILLIKFWKNQLKRFLEGDLLYWEELCAATELDLEQELYYGVHPDERDKAREESTMSAQIEEMQIEIEKLKERLKFLEELKSFHVAICSEKIHEETLKANPAVKGFLFHQSDVRERILRTISLMISAYEDPNHKLLEGPVENPLGNEIDDNLRGGVCHELRVFAEAFSKLK